MIFGKYHYTFRCGDVLVVIFFSPFLLESYTEDAKKKECDVLNLLLRIKRKELLKRSRMK
jgi:hypothetical protein